MSAVRLARRHEFQHRCPDGQNFSPEGPAHNYQLEVYIEGEIGQSGMVMNVRELDRLLSETIASLTTTAPTLKSPELAERLLANLRPALAFHNTRLIKLRLYESPDLWFDLCT